MNERDPNLWRRGLLLGLLFSLTACGGDSANEPIPVAIVASHVTGNAPMTIQFSAQLAPVDGAQPSYEWDFGDGTASTGNTVEHTFELAGEFDVSLNVSAAGRRGNDTVRIELNESADLMVADVVVSPMRATAGEEIQVNWSVSNRAAPVVGEWGHAVILSADRNFDADDRVVGRRTQSEPIGEGVLAQQIPVTLPEDIDSGDWYVAVVADYDGVVGDVDRTNNVFWSTGQLQIRNQSDTGPDLVICGFSIPAFDALAADVEPTVQLDDQLELDVCLGNVGNRPVGTASFSVFLSDDETLDPTDRNVGVSQSVALGPGDRTQVRVVVDIADPITAGAWYFIAQADPSESVDEQNENNNVRTWSDSVTVVEPGNVDGVDLVLKTFSTSAERVYWGQTMAGTVVIENRGTSAVERFFVVRFVAEPIAGGMPIVVHSINVDGIDAGATVELEVGIPINRRLDFGDYRVVGIADPTNSSNDVNLANNQRALSGALTLGGDPSVDPAVSDVILATETVAAGAEARVAASIRNLGQDASGQVEYSVVLSEDEILDFGDVTVLADSLANLDGGGLQNLELSFVVPLELDQQVPRWFVGVVVDPNRRISAELSEDNNVAFALESLEVTGAMGGCREDANEPNDSREQASELAVGSVEELGLCGNQDWYRIDVADHDVLNVSASWPVADGRLNLDLVDEQGSLIKAAAGVDGEKNVFLMPTDAPRTIYIRVVSEGTRFQYDLNIEFYNGQGQADLRVDDAAVIPSLAQPGQLVAARFQVSNVGTTGVDTTEAAVFLNDVPSSMGGTFLGRITVGELPARSAAEAEGTVSIPVGTANGDYYLVIVADGTELVDELDEDNNAVPIRLRVSDDLECTPDEREPNGSPHELNGAQPVANALAGGEYANLTVCAGDDDWYAVALGADQRLEASVIYQQNEGDVELALYDADGMTLLAESTSILGADSVEIARNEVPSTYYLRVYLNQSQGVVSNDYDLLVVTGPAELCEDDPFEPDDPETIPLLPDGLHDLQLCAGDEDAFRFAIPAGNTVSWTLTAGDAPLTITLYDPDGVEMASSERRIAHQAQQNGNYVVRVTSADGGEYPYQLRTSGVSGVDLAIESVEISRVAAGPGADLRVRSVLSNRRGDNARNFTVRYLLSLDDQPSADDITLRDRLIPLLQGAADLAIDTRVTLPNDFTPLFGAGNVVLPREAFIIGIVDPERIIPDVRLVNNEAAAAFEIQSACVDDDPRMNEGPGTATPLDQNGAELQIDAVICAFTEDWYELNPMQSGTLNVQLNFAHSNGDLDLVLYNAETGVELGASRTEQNVELVSVPIDVDDRLHIRVDGFDEAEASYRLTWSIE